ncbi:hypothetical protein M3J09_013876 [Ascochyta lentis]
MTKLCASFVPSARWICIFLYSRFRRVAIAIAVVILLPSSSHRRRHPIAVVIPSPSSFHRRRHSHPRRLFPASHARHENVTRTSLR